MKNKKSCRRRTLAKKGNFRIEGCKCGVAHLEIGPMSLRFQYDALEDLSLVLQTAVNNIKVQARDENPEEIQHTAFFGTVDQGNKLVN